MRNFGSASDSRLESGNGRGGGLIPGTPGVPAFVLSGAEPSQVPIAIAVPHAGRAYTAALLRNMRKPELAALRLEDRYVDRLALEVARETGAKLLIANAPRAMIDLNRAPDDIDWEMFNRADRPESVGISTGRRARSGLGLIPRRLPGIGELWKHRHQEAELTARIEGIHEPYHASLSQSLELLRARWGTAMLLDLHSMPPVARRPGLTAPEFVIGDRFGATCNGSLVAAAFSYFSAQSCSAAHNRPYAGGYVLERHGSPESDIHAIQLEIDRSTYLDSGLAEPGEGFAAVVKLLIGLVRNLAEEITSLSGSGSESRWAVAAE